MKSRTRVSIQQTQRLSLTTALTNSIEILRADAAGLTAHIEEMAAENPQILLSKPMVPEWLPRWKSAFAIDMDRPEQAAAAPSLVSHVLGMVDAMRLDQISARIAEALAGALEPTGWLGSTTEDIAQHLGVPVLAIETMLQRLQERAEPTGLFARNLAECLRLQAAEADELDPVMIAVLDRLPLLATGDLERIAREAGADVEAIRLCLGRIRRYDPKPGAGFEPLSAPLREPDLIAERTSAGWIVSLNRSSLPSITVAAGRAKGRAEARALVRMIEGRNATLLQVGQEILQRQFAALDKGISALEPMTMAEIATALGLHESTVSRVVAGAAVDTPRGTWWLRKLFTRSARAGGPAAGAMRDRLARLVAEESPEAPYSDDALAALLAAGGAPIARRTVAKYREMLQLPAAHRRRRRR